VLRIGCRIFTLAGIYKVKIEFRLFMKAIPKACCASVILMSALAVRAQILTYSNSVVVPGGNPPTVMAFNIPQFNPAEGTLDSVTLTMYSSFQFLFTYDGSLALGQMTFTQADSLTFLYNGSQVLSQANFGAFKFTAGLPSRGQSFAPATAPTLRGQSIFSDSADLANFTGTGEIPLNAEYYIQPTVTWTSGTITWSLSDSATMAAVVTYDFTPVPESGVMASLLVSLVVFALHQRRRTAGRPCRSDFANLKIC